MTLVPEKTRMTAAEYAQLPETNQPMELYDGELMIMPTPTPQHQILIASLSLLLSKIVRQGILFLSPLDVHLDELHVVQPDIMWVAPDSRCTIGEKYLLGAPDLVIEVLSPSTERRDRREKYALYERHGVREYWMVSSAAAYIEVYTLRERRFERLGIFTEGETIPSALLGEIAVTGIFQPA
jgi:Uma2 family endonuclease